jgi:hypothetical protein
MIDSGMRNLQILWRADAIIAEIKLRQLLRRSRLGFVAFVFVMFALAMLDATLFLAFETVWKPVWAAAAVCAFDLALGSLTALLALGVKPGRELELALETRAAAWEAIQRDADAVQRKMTDLHDEVRTIGRSIVRSANDPLYTVLPQLIVPLAGVLMKTLRKPESSPGPAASKPVD